MIEETTMLVGRQHELTILLSQFEKAVSGQLCVTLITGEPGIGKTSLLKTVAKQAEQAGGLVLHGSTSVAEGMPPYLPFLEALGSYIRTAPLEQLRSEVNVVAPILTMIFPELLQRLGELPHPGYPLPPEQARLRLYEAVGHFFTAIAASRPLLLLLDDLHQADTASLDLLSYIAQHQATSHLYILGAYRSDELSGSPALERCILSLIRNRQLTTLTLQPLPETDVTRLISHLLDVSPDSHLIQQLWKASEGNPFFLEELLRTWQETGVLVVAQDSASIGSSPPVSLPASISSLIRQRLARLPQLVSETLRQASLFGRSFFSGLLAEATGQDAEQVEEQLREAVLAGILHYSHPETYTFSHDLFREYLYNEITPARKKRLHGFIGRTLEARLDHRNAYQLAQLAYHFARSGDRARGGSYSQLAAEQAMHTSAPGEAMRHYRMALDLLEPHDQRCGGLWLALGEAALTAGAEHEAVEVFEAAQRWWSEPLSEIEAARAASGRGRAWARLEEHHQAQTAFEQALALLDERACTERIQVLVELATLLAVSLSKHTEGMVYGQQALELARQLAETRLEAMANRVVGNLLVRNNELSQGITLLERALALAEAASDPLETAESCACLTMAYFWSGRIQYMKTTLLRRIELAQRSQQPYQLRHLYTWLAASTACLGNFVEAEQWLTQAEQATASLASPEPQAFLLQIRSILATIFRDYEAAEQYLSQAMISFRQMGPGVYVWYLPILGWIQALSGKRSSAMAVVLESEQLLASQNPRTVLAGNVTMYLAQIALLLEDRERIARAADKLLPFQGMFLDGLVDRVLGMLSIFQAAWPEAQIYLERAEKMARQEQLLAELAFTHVAQAQCVLAQGGRGSLQQARKRFEQAQALFQECGLHRQVLAVQTQLEQLPERSPSRGTRTYPAGLSEREIEVLRLVAAGKSNRQIAEELVLSEKTVANHLARIFARTGTDNRAAAVAFAIRSGLA